MAKYETFEQFLLSIENEDNRNKLGELLATIDRDYPSLKHRIAWNQPMFTENDTFIIGFSVAKAHFAMAFEPQALVLFTDKAQKLGYVCTSNIVKIKWTDEIHYDFIKEIIDYKRIEKKDCSTFWFQDK